MLPELHPLLAFDVDTTIDGITAELRRAVTGELHRKGAVVGLSGGIDSSVCAGLAARALGPERVRGLLMPETDSADDTLDLSRLVASALGVQTEHEDITPILEGAGCYRRRDEAIRLVLPDFGDGWRSKIVLPSVVDSDAYRVYSLVAQPPHGDPITVRLPLRSYLEVVAATNFKQRTRKMLEYYWADRLNFAVMGTPNRLEYDQGFFVKNGDGAADVKPIAGLYKSQVYELAAHLGVPEEIRRRPPTTDTYSLPQSQEEFYFSLPYDKMDLCLFGVDNQLPAEQVAEVVGLEVEQVLRVFRDIDSKRRVTHYLNHAPMLLGPAQPIGGPFAALDGIAACA